MVRFIFLRVWECYGIRKRIVPLINTLKGILTGVLFSIYAITHIIIVFAIGKVISYQQILRSSDRKFDLE